MTGSGLSVLVTDRSAGALTVVEAEAELFAPFGSVDPVFPRAVFVMTVAPGVPGFTCTTIVKVALAAAANDDSVHVTAKGGPEPGAGGVQANVGPASWTNETNVVFAGTPSVSSTLSA